MPQMPVSAADFTSAYSLKRYQARHLMQTPPFLPEATLHETVNMGINMETNQKAVQNCYVSWSTVMFLEFLLFCIR